ncbi:Gfo/Idh/MocA family oxidoreductase [Subtercola sp. PAMC28395]|uniref:Gfo/Idh/MocA family protein n=1 Tax=Subtercola sp. PAMC28395 TaxID=2846775 RepID=UPI001C0B4349|nr:Gfo/Idh/MocA family oxidoreductase [Subtercola sp. PAMC28395]QWT23498.1 Gfo/Idh/MocA family oxidoreductase [Subtercola sp. PAMC28395]
MTRTAELFQAPIRTALIGFGLGGRVFHAPFLAADARFSLDAIVTGDPARQADAHARYPETSVIASVPEFFEVADDVDLVVISSPPSAHYALASAAIDAGLSIVIDKPFTTNSGEGLDLITRAEERGLLLTVFQNRRWDGDFQTVSDLVAGGALGEIHHFESRFEWWKPQGGRAWKGEATVAEGGGILFDLGPHLIDQALQLFGPTAEIYSELATRRPGAPAEDDVFLALTHESGVTSHLWMSGFAAQKGPRFRMLGSKGAYTKFGLDGQEPALIAGAVPNDEGFGVSPKHEWGVLGIDGDLAPVETRRGSYAGFYSQLADALTTGAPLPVDPRDSQAITEIIENIHATTRTRRQNRSQAL